MQRNLLHKAMKIWLPIVFGLLPLSIYALGEKLTISTDDTRTSHKAGGEKAPAALGGFITDPDADVPENAYVTFSTLYNGRRYYLGVDTVLAKTGKDTVMYYESPNYATMWIAGPMWSPTGKVLPTKDYTRTIQSVWLKEKVSRNKYLALGTGSGTYSTLRLLAEGTMWHTEKDDREPSKYINGFLYYYSDATGIDVYRYLRYDPVYGFSRLYETKPANSQRISVWDRKTGSDLIYKMNPTTITFGYSETDREQPITSQVIYYTDVDRFRSRYDQVDIYVRRSEPITNQQTLVSDYGLVGHFEWKSNPMDHTDAATIAAYDGNSLMPYYTITNYDDSDPENPIIEWGWQNLPVVRARKDGFRLKENVWYDTIYAIASPIDDPEGGVRFLRKPADGSAPTEGAYTNQNDWLYTHFTCDNKEYIDSVYVVFQAFHHRNFTTLTIGAVDDEDNTIEDYIFPYYYNGKMSDGTTLVTDADKEQTFTVNAHYTSGYDVVSSISNVVSTYVGTEQELDLSARTPVEEDGVHYNELLVEARNADDTPCGWLHVGVTTANQIHVEVDPYDPNVTQNRFAKIVVTYNYQNMVDNTNRASATRTIWITQKWKDADSNESYIYAFSYKNPGEKGVQDVHEKHNTFYAIPGEDLSLPLHRDHWGYYRWFLYDENDASKMGRDVLYMNTWSWASGENPKNQEATPREFMLINNTGFTTSRGRWDMIKDVANPSNPIYANDHFVQWTATHVPAVKYPEETSESLTKSGKIACDVSEYFDVATTGVTGSSLTAMTEPTLSYRQVFDIHPAKDRADQLAAVKGDGNGANWLETHSIVVPAGREFFIQPQCPIAAVGADDINEEHLQYIYYANPNSSNYGTRTGLTDVDLQENMSYARVGKKKTVNARKVVTLVPYSQINGLGEDGSISNIILVNPRKNTGYIVGHGNQQIPIKMDYVPYQETKDLFKSKLEDQLNSGTFDNYLLSIRRNGRKNEFVIKHGEYALFDLYTLYSEGERRKYNVRWYDGNPTGEKFFTLDSYIGSLDSNLPSGYTTGDFVTIHWDWWEAYSHKGYLKATPRISSEEHDKEDLTPEYAWLIYKVETINDKTYEEIPRWEKSTDGSSWKEIIRWNYSTNKGDLAKDVTGYDMTADGALHITNENVHPTAGAPIYYRLRTEHFQLAKFTGMTRPADTEMLKLGDIISEDDIERDYNIIYSLDMENWSKPGTSEVTAYNYHFPWDFTELSYHYPVGDGKNEVPAQKRIFKKAIPGKGEYCFLNKFVVPSKEEAPNTNNNGEVFECMAGAENGYMLCVNAAHKRTTIMNFEYDQLSCSGQQIYLVGNYCNPINNPYDPQITADLEGWDGSKWVPIYRYKSGKIKYHPATEQHWYQMALPIARERIEGYSKFRCRGEIDGAANKNCHLLIDRLRFIEKARGFTVFQDKATCIEDDSVTVLIRLNYNADPDLYKPGKLVAYQFQKWDKTANEGAGGYVPINASTDNGDGTYTALTKATGLQVAPGYMKDAFTTKESVETPSLKTLAKNDYGYVMIPEADYDPSKSNTAGGQSAKRQALIEQAITKLGLTGEAATARHAFINETGNVRTFDQVMNNDLLFGGATPHVKSFVKEGDNWVIYLATRLPISATQNNTFRVGMAVMNNLNDQPTFTEDACATFHIFKIKQTTALNVNGALWTNHPRSWYDGSAGKERLAANETYRASVALQLDETVFGNNTANPRCKFDLLHATENVRANDAAFAAKYGCTRTQFKDDMEAFRNDDEDNPNREVTDWAQVTWQNFTGTGRTEDVAKAIYNRLNHLVTSGLLEIGLDYRDIYMGDRADSYFYLIPVPATGRYESVLGNHDASADTTMHASVCNDTLWLELHSEEPTAKLRFGYDSRIGDTYIVPTIRASRTDANEHLKVRVAEISTSSDAESVVIGWEKTELIDSNDPAWTGTQVFKYKQDKDMRTHKPNEVEYYEKGDEITFTPQTSGNNITLKAGYWYQFKAPFYAVSKLDKYTADPATPTGHSQFILAIAPDTVRWTPSHPDAANYWNDDSNWTPVMHNTPAGGFKATVPMGDTKVIIPAVEEGMAPIASDIVAEQKDRLHYGYAKNTCSAILFYPNAQILGQEKIAYDKAYVDVPMTTGTWQTFSPALDDIYSGDMYIPFSTSYNHITKANSASTDNEDFAPKPFPFGEGYSGTYNPRVYPFAFYQGFYNSSVPVQYYNTDEEGSPVATTTVQSKSSVDWVKTNALNMHYAPGKACVLTGYDATDEDGRPIVIRLPKPEDSYCGFGKNGGTNYIAGSAIAISRSANPQRNLAYDQYAGGFSTEDGLTYTLTNASESEIFFFGNPTMSLVDVYRLCVANADVLKHEEGTYHFTAYNLIDGDNYTVKTITGPGQFFIAPMRAVGLIANATQTTARTLPIKLTPSALVAIAGDGKIINSGDIMTPMPRRALNSETIGTKRLYIAAANETDWGVKKAYLTLGEQEDAQRGYRFGEDALSIASGLNYYSDESFSTPLSMYTISDNKALMQDIRDTLTSVPLVFTTLDDHYSFDTHTILSFSMDGDWGEVYLYDALNGDSIRIVDGMQIAVETPVSNQLRYFINGKRENKQEDTDHPGVSTGIENVNDQMPNDQMVNDQMVNVFDVLGHKVAVLGKYDILTHIKLPTGVYIIQRGDKTERVVIR